MKNAMFLTDGYKLDHRRQYPKGTEKVYSTWIPRSNTHLPQAKDGAVVFGIQYLIKEYLIKQFNENFFNRPKDEVLAEYEGMLCSYLGAESTTTIGLSHIAALHDLGYLPIEIKALPEGSVCPIGVPYLTIVNTNDDFYWITNYLETIISNVLWMPSTSATIARLYKQELVRHAKKTGFYDEALLNFLCHDFSMRGMSGLDATITSGMAHLTSFAGSESIPAIMAVNEYYGGEDNGLIAGTIPASEHSVMCAGGFDDELGTFKRFITEIYPNGFVSIVSDTWDFWKVMTEYTVALKDEILARDGRTVFRPDSSPKTPCEIICGDAEAKTEWERKGAYEVLWDIFGGTTNEQGYKILNPKVGIIYGDSITIDLQKRIYAELEAKGFCASNLVLGVGSFTYQYKTRDSLGFAMKATWCQINGVPTEIFKDPKTDDGTKKSLKGLCSVWCSEFNSKVFEVIDQCTPEVEAQGELKTIFKDGVLVIETSLNEIRERLCKH